MGGIEIWLKAIVALGLIVLAIKVYLVVDAMSHKDD